MTAEQAVTLTDLGLTAQGGRSPVISGLAIDSRKAKPGCLFAALPGTQVHGASFIDTAIENGAVAILTDAVGAELAAKTLSTAGVALVIAEDPHQALAYTAAIWFQKQPETMIAVTGTNGKTSVATFARQIWAELGYDAVNLGTTGVEGAFTAPLHHTTPDPLTLHKTLRDCVEAGVTHAAMEASSHGLAQRRLDGVHLLAAGFTNLTQDHLDYHNSFDDYFDAKAGLFTRVLPPESTAVVNIDNPWGGKMATRALEAGQKVLRVGRSSAADLQLQALRFDNASQEIRFGYEGTAHHCRLSLIGGFQAENVLMAAGLVIAAGADPREVFSTLEHLRTVRGRMQLAATRANGAGVFVDYAHTPDAVKTALQALRPHVMGRLVVVVGAGGDRDRTKRPLMGEAAAVNADLVIVTDDNPRSEDPEAIRQAVMMGCPDAIEVGDRAEAILRGVDALGQGDALLIAGKGHETGQTVGDIVFPFDDVEQASLAVSALDGGIA